MEINVVKALEKSILVEFKKASAHLRDEPATPAMQEQLRIVASPYHEKLKELGYTWDESRAMLREAFDHQPPSLALGHGARRKRLRLTVLAE